jgi:hypothetical protein
VESAADAQQRKGLFILIAGWPFQEQRIILMASNKMQANEERERY